jgi:hypothetical protein
MGNLFKVVGCITTVVVIYKIGYKFGYSDGFKEATVHGPKN